jgi:hypothetical protein
MLNMGASQFAEFSTILNQMLADLFVVRVMMKREGLKGVDCFGSPKLLYSECNTRLAEGLSIEVQVPAFQFVVDSPILECLLSSIENNTSGLTGSETCGVYEFPWLEECPKKVVRDLLMQKQGGKML